jgi:hypothetical protein
MNLKNQIVKLTGTDETVVDVEVDHPDALHGVVLRKLLPAAK